MNFNSRNKMGKMNYLMDIFLNDKMDELNLITNYPSFYNLKFMDNRWSVLHLSCYYNHLNGSKVILDNSLGKKLINQKDNNGEIPLHLACLNKNIDLILLLIKNDSEIEIKNNNEFFPFDFINDYIEIESIIKKIVIKHNKLSKKNLKFLNNYLNLIKNKINNKIESKKLKDQKKMIKDNTIKLNILKVNNIQNKFSNNKLIDDLNRSIEKFLSNNDILENKELIELNFDDNQLYIKNSNPFLKFREYFDTNNSFFKYLYNSILNTNNKIKDKEQNKKEKEFFYEDIEI